MFSDLAVPNVQRVQGQVPTPDGSSKFILNKSDGRVGVGVGVARCAWRCKINMLTIAFDHCF